MPFCCACGTKLGNQDKFCFACGTPTTEAPVASAPASPTYTVAPYTGEKKAFSLQGAIFIASSGMDAFNYYRTVFKAIAKKQALAFEAEYRARIGNLDSFFVDFPQMYAFYRKPIIDCAMSIILQSGIYDLSESQFEEQHTADFCLCGEEYKNLVESFNLTIEANQDKKIRMYNMMPGVVFSGLGGLAAAFALNVAVTSIAEADIKRANVSQKQRAEIFGRINTAVLMDEVFTDYWRVFLSMTWQMQQRGMDMWYPNDDGNRRAEGLYQNLVSGMLPKDKIPDLLVQLLGLNPYANEPLLYIRQNMGTTDETRRIFDYFGIDD